MRCVQGIGNLHIDGNLSQVVSMAHGDSYKGFVPKFAGIGRGKGKCGSHKRF